MINKIKNFFKKDKFMRPKVFAFNEGTVSLQGFDSDLSDALAEHIRNFGKEAPVQELPVAALPPPEVLATPGVYAAKAIGTYLNPKTNKYQFITVGVDPATKTSFVEQVEDISEFHRESAVAFKRKAFDLKFI